MNKQNDSEFAAAQTAEPRPCTFESCPFDLPRPHSINDHPIPPAPAPSARCDGSCGVQTPHLKSVCDKAALRKMYADDARLVRVVREDTRAQVDAAVAELRELFPEASYCDVDLSARWQRGREPFTRCMVNVAGVELIIRPTLSEAMDKARASAADAAKGE